LRKKGVRFEGVLEKPTRRKEKKIFAFHLFINSVGGLMFEGKIWQEEGDREYDDNINGRPKKPSNEMALPRVKR